MVLPQPRPWEAFQAVTRTTARLSPVQDTISGETEAWEKEKWNLFIGKYCVPCVSGTELALVSREKEVWSPYPQSAS